MARPHQVAVRHAGDADVALPLVEAMDLAEAVSLEAQDQRMKEVEDLDGRRVRQWRQVGRQQSER